MLQSWLIDYHRGLRWLAHHRPLRALIYLERALLSIPTQRSRTFSRRPSRRAELAKLFYYFGVALAHAHFHNRSIGSLVEAARLEKRGHLRLALLHRTNCYGMARQRSSQLDDKYAFFGIHLARYLRSKQSHRLGTKAEIDMIGDLIEEYWHALRSSYDLGRLNTAQKRMLFRETPVVFPFFSVPQELGSRTGHREVSVDFHRGVRLRPGDRCSCGSGLPFRVCHGRIPGLDELVSG